MSDKGSKSGNNSRPNPNTKNRAIVAPPKPRLSNPHRPFTEAEAKIAREIEPRLTREIESRIARDIELRVTKELEAKLRRELEPRIIQEIEQRLKTKNPHLHKAFTEALESPIKLASNAQLPIISEPAPSSKYSPIPPPSAPTPMMFQALKLPKAELSIPNVELEKQIDSIPPLPDLQDTARMGAMRKLVPDAQDPAEKPPKPTKQTATTAPKPEPQETTTQTLPSPEPSPQEPTQTPIEASPPTDIAPITEKIDTQPENPPVKEFPITVEVRSTRQEKRAKESTPQDDLENEFLKEAGVGSSWGRIFALFVVIASIGAAAAYGAYYTYGRKVANPPRPTAGYAAKAGLDIGHLYFSEKKPMLPMQSQPPILLISDKRNRPPR